jgi:lysophospholipase L1-like esterase
MDHFAITGSGGFDLYVRQAGQDRFVSTFRPSFGYTEGYESLFDFKSSEMREITINFPLYSDVCELYIGLEGGAKIEAPTPYSSEKPVVYYGSSITQGGCASRPGNAYPSILSRKYDLDFINLGFSGNARGEREIAEYIASLDMYAFVYDYDHNAHSAEYLEKTHEPMFKLIRASHPELPIIMMTGASMARCFDNKELRREIIYKTYKNALDAGDKNVYFIDGSSLFRCDDGDMATVDRTHPNDYGFYRMAKAVESELRWIWRSELVR